MHPARIHFRELFFGIFGLPALLAALALPAHQQGLPGGTVYYVGLDGDDGNPGTAERPWRHIEWAMTRPFLRGGDTIRVRGGLYRPVAEATPHRDSTTDDTLIRPVAAGEPGRPITVMAEPGETVVLSGRFLAASWDPAGAGSAVYYHDYSTPLIYPFDHPFQVVEDGRLLYRVASLAGVDRPGRCFVDTGQRRIFVRTTDGRPPSAHLMEYGGSASGIEFRGVQHWRLSGFSLRGFRATGVMVANRAGHIEIDRMDISHVGAHRPGADLSNGYAIAIYDTTGGNYIHDNNLHRTLAEAVHISQTGAGGDVYENNDIHRAGGGEWFHEGHAGRLLTGPGLILRGSRVTVRGNRFYGNGYHGLILESDLRGAEGRASPSHNVIEGNVFAFNSGNGIYGDGKNGLDPSVANVIRFNLLDRNNQSRAGSGGDGELRLAGNLDDTLVHNNTFYSEKANGVLLFTARVSDGTAQGADAVPERARLFNNIAVHAGQVRQTYPLRAVDAAPDIASDYNNWYRAGQGGLISWNGTEFVSLENFRTRTGQERRGMSLDPRFVSIENGHFWLRIVSPMIGRGLAESGMAADLGAFPYRPLLLVSPAELRLVTLAGSGDLAAKPVAVQSAAEAPMAWTARTAGQSWLIVSASGGKTPGRLDVSVRAAGLAAGTHTAAIQVAPALEGEPPFSVPVILTVLPAPPRRR